MGVQLALTSGRLYRVYGVSCSYRRVRVRVLAWSRGRSSVRGSGVVTVGKVLVGLLLIVLVHTRIVLKLQSIILSMLRS